MTTQERERKMFGLTLAELKEFAGADPLRWSVSIMSDAQELASLGDHEGARMALNRAKWLVDTYRIENRIGR